MNRTVGKIIGAMAKKPDGASSVMHAMKMAPVASTSDINFDTVKATLDGNVATISLSRPKRGNAMNMQLWEELEAAMTLMDHVKEARCVILRGDGPNFTTGMDLQVFQDLMGVNKVETCPGRFREGMMKVIEFFQAVISSPEKCRVPVIAAIEGHCIGAGVDLITACDIRYTTKDTKFSIKETDLAIVADIGTLQRLPKVIPEQRARELAYTGRTFTGEEAKEYGLVLEAFDTAEEMHAHVNEVAKSIAQKSPLTVRGIKSTALFTRDNSVAAGLDQVKMLNAAILMSDDLSQVMGSFATKQAPEFKD